MQKIRVTEFKIRTATFQFRGAELQIRTFNLHDPRILAPLPSQLIHFALFSFVHISYA
jgi:hypothetical protein